MTACDHRQDRGECQTCYPNGYPTVAEVCVLTGPGYGECWSCPVKKCPLWQSPGAAFAKASLDVAARAQEFVENKRYGSLKVEDAMDLILGTEEYPGLVDAEVQENLRVRQAAEAVVQGLFIPGKEAAERKAYQQYMERVRNRVPTPDDEVWLDTAIIRAQAREAATEYECPAEKVEQELAFVRGLKLKPTREWRNS